MNVGATLPACKKPRAAAAPQTSRHDSIGFRLTRAL